MASLLIVDDHPLFRDGFAHMVRALRPDWSLRAASSSVEALVALGEARPDLVILDVGLPGEDGFALMKAIATIHPGLPQVMISGREDAAARIRARASGARTYLAKTAAPEAMVAAIDAVLAGRDPDLSAPASGGAPLPSLTPRQAEVLELLAEGHGNKQIRHRLGIAERTVRAHLTDLFHLLGAHSRTHAIVRARELGLIG